MFLSLDILIIHLDHSKCEILLFKGLWCFEEVALSFFEFGHFDCPFGSFRV